jgi:type I restriction enzyme S subunit
MQTLSAVYWRKIKLADLERDRLLLLRNGFPCGSNNEDGRGIPQLRPMNIDNSGRISLSQVKHVEPGRDVSSYLLCENDIIFNNTNSRELVGKTAVWVGPPGEYVLSNHMTILRLTLDSGVDSHFLAFYFHRLWITRYFEQLRQQHVNQASISLERLRDIEVSIPPFLEQRAIAHALRTVQEAKEARRRELALERERKAALMQHLFTHGTRGEPLKETEIGLMPESWRVVKLGDFIINGPQNGAYKHQQFYGDGTPIVRIDAFDNDGRFVTLDFKRVRLLDSEINLYRLIPKDILINRVNSLSHLGKCALVPELTEATIFESNMMRFHVDETRLLPDYLIRYLVTNDNKRRMKGIAKLAIAQASINQGDVKSLPVPLPCISQQCEIANVLTACDNKITALEHEATLLDELFRAMLEELITGRLSAQALIEHVSLPS